jgi:Tol biopolymer transport system component
MTTRTRRVRRTLVAAGVAVVLTGVAAQPSAGDLAGTTTRVSVSGSGEQAHVPDPTLLPSFTAPSISGDGRYVAFDSWADNLVPDDTNGVPDVFVRDRVAETTTLVSTGGDGEQATNESVHPSITADGRYVAFVSGAANLVRGDTNRTSDVFVKDRLTGSVRRVSLSPSGSQFGTASADASISASGRFVAFRSGGRVFLRDRQQGRTETVAVTLAGTPSAASSRLSTESVSASGRYVVFTSIADDLVPGDTNGRTDAFLRDRMAGTTTLVSASTAGVQADLETEEVSISANGRFVVFWTQAANLVPRDTNDAVDVFLWNRATGTTRRISISSAGVEASAGATGAVLSRTGRYVAFESESSDLVDDDTNRTSDIFVRDRFTGKTTRVSLAHDGSEGNNGGGSIGSHGAELSGDGRVVGFTSWASNLVPDDTNAAYDVFVRDLG